MSKALRGSAGDCLPVLMRQAKREKGNHGNTPLKKTRNKVNQATTYGLRNRNRMDRNSRNY